MNLYEAQQALDKALDSLDDSAFNLADGRTIVTVNRAYYAIYYCMYGLLITKQIGAKTHQGIQAKFSEVFIKSGLFPLQSAKWISTAFNLRQLADYDLETHIEDPEATLVLKQAQDFYQLSKRYLEKLVQQNL